MMLYEKQFRFAKRKLFRKNLFNDNIIMNSSNQRSPNYTGTIVQSCGHSVFSDTNKRGFNVTVEQPAAGAENVRQNKVGSERSKMFAKLFLWCNLLTLFGE